MSSLQAPRGTFDVLPADAERRAGMEAHAARILGAAGYGRIETPTFEATELYARGVGESTDIVQKEMYTFSDDAGRSLTLRPEGTAGVCRAYLEHGMQKLPAPVKLWYLESFFRTERTQRGRYRQFWQVGAEVIGAAGPETDAELIMLLAELYEAVGVRDWRLRISSLGTPQTRAAYREELTAFLRAREDGLSPEVVARIDLNPMRAFDASDERTRRTMADAPLLLDRLAPDDEEHFMRVRELLDDADIAYTLDPTLVRGLDYYVRTLFEFTSESLGAQSAVGGGGRYDGLIEQLGGPRTPACGWATGVERILLAAGEVPTPRPSCDLYVAIVPGQPAATRAAFTVTGEARHAGLAAQMELAGRSLKGQLKQADRCGARYVAIIDDDVNASLKNMESGEQVEIKRTSVIATILRGQRL
jgi:histidyl-tRNA synthetase